MVHAGCQATLADHTAGIAASTMLSEPANSVVLSANFKIDLLRPGVVRHPDRDALICRAKVLKSGRSLIVTEAEVYIFDDDTKQETLISKMSMLASVVSMSKLGSKL